MARPPRSSRLFRHRPVYIHANPPQPTDQTGAPTNELIPGGSDRSPPVTPQRLPSQSSPRSLSPWTPSASPKHPSSSTYQPTIPMMSILVSGQLPHHHRHYLISPMPPSTSIRSSEHLDTQSMPEETTGAASRSAKPHNSTRSWSLGSRGRQKASKQKHRQRRSRAVTSALYFPRCVTLPQPTQHHATT